MRTSVFMWVWTSVSLLCVLCSVFSQTTIGADCGSGVFYITQPAKSLPCNPYPPTTAEVGETTSLKLECSAVIPASLASSSAIVWSKLHLDGETLVQLSDGMRGTVKITKDLIQPVQTSIPTNVVVHRSVLELKGLKQNSTKSVGHYYCHVIIELNDVAAHSNISITTELLESTAYADLDQCASGSVFLTLSTDCVSFSSEITTPDIPDTSPSTTATAASVTSDVPDDSGTSASLLLSLEMVIIIGSVGGVMAVLVCILFTTLLITCCCARKYRNTRSTVRTIKDRTIPLYASMNSINLIENGNPRIEPVTIVTIDTPLTHLPAPSHPPPIHSSCPHSTLPSRLKQNVAKVDSSEGSVTSSSPLIRKGHTATVIDKLKTACTPQDEGNQPMGLPGENSEVYKSLIPENMDETGLYVVTNPLGQQDPSLHGSCESLDVDGLPVYSEPTIPKSASILSLSQLSQQVGSQPNYTEPTLPHSLSSSSLLTRAITSNEDVSIRTRSRLSLPLKQKLAVSAVIQNQEQPIYSEVDSCESDSSNKTTPTRQKRKPIVPPRPPARQNNKPSPIHALELDCNHIQRESVDGEYVHPNLMLNSTTKRRGLKEAPEPPHEVMILRNGEIAPPPHQYQGLIEHTREYLTLYMTPDN